jgi:hypothetical protein
MTIKEKSPGAEGTARGALGQASILDTPTYTTPDAGRTAPSTGDANYCGTLSDKDAEGTVKAGAQTIGGMLPAFEELFPRLTTGDAATREFLTAEFSGIARQAHALQGMRAFENTKRATAYHEAGHVVVSILSGRTVNRVWIKRVRDGDVKHWTGRTFDGSVNETTSDTPVETDIESARNIIAGWMAEVRFNGRDLRLGSSLDEVVRFKAIVGNIVLKTGAPFESISLEILNEVFVALDRCQVEVEAIAAELMNRGELRWHAIQKLTKKIRRLS